MPTDPSPALQRARTCAVLAGGLGRRIGGAKALAPLAGRPLIAHALAAVEAAGLRALVVAKPDTALSGLGLAPGSILREPAEPRHPLLGLAAALDAIGEPLVSCPCDMPLLPAGLLAELADRGEPYVTLAVGGSLEPLVGRYGPRAAPVLAAAAEHGAAAREAVAALDPALLTEAELRRHGDPRTITRSVNTLDELREVEALLPG